MAAPGRDIQGFKIGDLATVVALSLQDHIVFLTALDVGRGAARAEHGLQRAADRLGRNAQCGGFLRIDIDQQTR